MNDERRTTNDERRRFGLHPSPFIFLPFALCIFLVLGAFQLNLPGLHYDEAKEAGLNAMQLVTRQPVTAFRDATVQIGPWRLPLMVQDYIGSLNVLLAVPFLAVGGVNVIALRWLPLLTAALTLLLTWRVAWRLGGPWAAGVTALLLAVNPSFVFWSRQGIFVTNLTALIFMASLLTALRWWTARRPADLWLTAFLWGLGLYAKLLFVWAIGAMVLVGGIAWLLKARNLKLETRNWKLEAGNSRPTAATSAQLPTSSFQLPTSNLQPPTSSFQLRLLTWGGAAVAFLLPLSPLILFNIRTSGTLSSIFGNLGRSYYGVDNAAYLVNLLARLKQLVTLLRGDHLWYLGEVYANVWAPWLAGGLVVAALVVWGSERLGERAAGRADVAVTRAISNLQSPISNLLLPLALLALMTAQSAFTVSDLFITHFALLLPLIPLAGGLAFADVMQNVECRMQKQTRSAFIILISAFVLLWAGGDLWTTIRYHRILAISGGYAAHSDAISDLATYLARRGPSALVALDWGLDAPVRFLTVGKVNPIEVFGYAAVDAPDPEFTTRMSGFLENPDSIYLAHMPDATVFHGRVEALSRLAAERGLALREVVRFAERSGRPLFVVYRVTKP